ncbi:hypothetical protein D7V91_15670 [bacterium 1xD42-67]|nr:hypothetical protein D7V91_15670 [bacterium 1xD42-67]
MYILLMDDDAVQEIVPDEDPVFPGIPIEERYAPDFVARLIYMPAGTQVEQGHTSAAEWPPEEAPALYTRIGLSSSGWPVWSPPTGAQDAYDTGDIVSHRGTLYKSKIDGNTTEPGADDRWWEIYVEV